jgi:hypothetical protein
MITIPLAWAISLYLFLTLAIVFIGWIFYNKNGKAIDYKTSDMMQCPYCACIFLKLNEKEIVKCPKCKSYVSAQDHMPQTRNT